MSNTIIPAAFLTEGGIGDATPILRDYHKQALAESNKARDIEEDVIIQLTGLRSDLSQKCKEIKGLSGDFKNAVDKETEGTRRAVRDLQEALGLVDTEPNATIGRGDPFIVKLRVERQIEKQIDEENYLHRVGSFYPVIETMEIGHLYCTRLSSTLRTLVENLSRSWSAKSKKPTTHMPGYSHEKLMKHMKRSRDSRLVPFPCQRIANGMLSCMGMSIL